MGVVGGVDVAAGGVAGVEAIPYRSVESGAGAVADGVERSGFCADVVDGGAEGAEPMPAGAVSCGEVPDGGDCVDDAAGGASGAVSDI